MYVITVLHIMGISAFLLLVNKILKISFSKKYKEKLKVWKFLHGSGILSIFLTVLILVFGYVNMHNVVKTEYEIKTAKNIRDKGYRVAVLADIHFGVSLDEDELKALCNRISEENLDVVILGGDIVDDGTKKESLNVLFSALGGIKSKYGVFYVYGNHDIPFKMVQSGYSESDLVSAITENEIRILEDEIFSINDELFLIGRNDKGFDGKARKTIDELSKMINQEKFILSLDHIPCEYDESGRAGVDLILSGHTHGGQFFPVNLIDKLFKLNDANYGYTQIDEDSAAIVTSGVAGWAYPVKTSAPAEYVVVNIVKG